MKHFRTLILTTVPFDAIGLALIALGHDDTTMIIGIALVMTVSFVAGIAMVLKSRERMAVDYPAGELKDVILFKD